MKTLSRDEMKKVFGGLLPLGGDGRTYKCCVGTSCMACAGWVNCAAGATQYEC